MLVLGDFNTHSRSWGCDSEDSSARAVQNMFDDLNLVHLNDGTHTRNAAPPRKSSAIDLTLSTAGLALRDYTWTVLEDAGSSDHLPILTSFQSFQIPTDLPIPIFDLSRHISWSVYADAILDSLATAVRGMDVGIRYDNFVETIRSSALAAQTRPLVGRRTPPSLRSLWWDAECDRLNDAKLLAFRNFRSNESSANYEDYKIAERNLRYTCKTKKIDSWRRYCATMTYETRLTDIWKMTKRLRSSRALTVTDRNPDSWLPEFASRIAPDFVPTQCNLSVGEDSLRYSWLAEEFDLEDLNAALSHCSNSAPGLNGWMG
jgi:hypothetical protein